MIDVFFFCFSADHDDQEVVLFNRTMLPAYYGLLRMCCQCSRPFTRQLAQHQNIQWAFKNITPYLAQYTLVSARRTRSDLEPWFVGDGGKLF